MAKGEAPKVKRRSLYQRATDRFTAKRKEHQELEDLQLVDDFALWFSTLSGEKVRQEHFCEDLVDGRVLCEVLSLIEGSGITEWHDTEDKDFEIMKEFYSRENITLFQNGCRKLNIPSILSIKDLKENKISPVISCLVRVAMVVMQNDFELKNEEGEIVEIPEEIRERVETIMSEEEQPVEAESDEPENEEVAVDAAPAVEDIIEEAAAPEKQSFNLVKSIQDWFAGLKPKIEEMKVAMGCAKKKEQATEE